MKPIRIGVVEDDSIACQRDLDHLNRYQSEEGEQFVVSVFNDSQSIVDSYAPVYDILLMDIEMKGLNGMDAAKEIRKHDKGVVIIFITAAPQYAISGYQVQALSYLLKPVPYFAFHQEIKRSITQVRQHEKESMLVETTGKQTRLELNHIFYIESIRHIIVIHTYEGKVSISSSLKELEAQLQNHDFYRSNSCYLLNLRYVDAIEEQDAIMANGDRLRISRPRKKGFLSALTDFVGGSTR